MSTEAMEVDSHTSGEDGPILYGASWVNKLSEWVNGRPGQRWAYYLGLAALLFLLQSVVLWIEEKGFSGAWLPIHLFLACAISLFLALLNYLDTLTGAALESLRPMLKASEETYLELHYRLTTLPARPTFLAGLVMLSLSFLSEAIGGPFHLDRLAGLPVSRTLFRFVYLASWWLLGTFLYHSFHQLRMIDHIYTKYSQINLFRAKPFYAFSVPSAFTAGSLGMIIYGWLLVNPTIQLNDPIVLVWVTVILVAAVVAFLWPQLGMHRLQVAEQERLLDEAYARLETIVSELHRQLDNGEYGAAADLSSAIGSLESEVNAIKSIRTWPWEPETLRLLITALALPLGLWLIQLILERLLDA